MRRSGYSKGGMQSARCGYSIYCPICSKPAARFDENERAIEGTGRYLYAADENNPSYGYWIMPDGTYRDSMPWRPSIHMPREAARIFLRGLKVYPQRLKEVTEEDAKAEGFRSRAEFISAILKMYPDCTEESWFWAVEFERISKEDAYEVD